jgi:nucleotide-binding universal stress UspA family protein
MRHVLAATDFSQPSDVALDRAASVAAAHPGADVTLLHVLSAPGLEVVRRMLGEAAAAMEPRVTAEAEEKLTATADALHARHGCKVQTRLVQGKAVREIAAVADDVDADLIVMGARGENPARDFFVGNTTDRVLRKTKRPLLAVRRPADAAYRRVVVPVDFSRHSAPLVRTAERAFPNAEMVLLHAYEVAFESKFRLAGATDDAIVSYREQAKQAADRQMNELVERLDLPASRLRRQIVHGAAVPTILEQIRQLDADLVAIGKHGESMLGDMLMGSVVRRILVDSPTDILISSGAGD